MRLSASLIVRNESRFIDECLASLAGVVDEIVVVDTGSTDDTIERALRYPVRLHHFPWNGSFSDARNHALDCSTGEWILYIDADERFIPLAPDWRQALEDPLAAAVTVRLHPRLDWTAYDELRLFRNDPRIRFRGVIHETIHPDIRALCEKGGMRTATGAVALQHVGYEGDQTHKVPRNLPLLRTYLETDPNRIFCWWHLGDNLSRMGDQPAAIEAWRQGVEVVRRRGSAPLDSSDKLIFLTLIRALKHAGEDVDALITEGLARAPGFLAIEWTRALVQLDRGESIAPRPVFEKLAAIDPETFHDPEIAYEKAIFRYQAREGLAVCDFRDGRYREAAANFRAAAEHAPNRQELLARAVVCDMRAAARPQDGRSDLPVRRVSEPAP